MSVDKNGNAKVLTGYLLLRPASWPLGCLLGKAEEIMTVVFSPWDGGEGAGRERQLCMYVCMYVRVLFMYADGM